jgi:hypothetical protein
VNSPGLCDVGFPLNTAADPEGLYAILHAYVVAGVAAVSVTTSPDERSFRLADVTTGLSGMEL